MFQRLLGKARDWLNKVNVGQTQQTPDTQNVEEAISRLQDQAPVPVFWLFGKTQSGKTSLIKNLTGADRAEIGQGFRPCTRFSSKYVFPNEEVPLLSFLDTRGLDEPGYEASEDLARFDSEAHVVLVVVKALDHAQENVRRQLAILRAARPRRPVVLVLTCLHEAYPQQQHVSPYPFGNDATLELEAGVESVAQLGDLLRSVAEHKRAFADLVDRVVAVDFTPPEEGFHEPNYGAEALRRTLLEVLPAAFGQTLRTIDAAQGDKSHLRDHFDRQALPIIVLHTKLAATAGAVPLPFVDLVVVSGIQTRMVTELANLYGQPINRERLKEVASVLGVGLLTRQATRTLFKFVPGLGSLLGSLAGGALAAASTYALGKAFCHYYRVVHDGHIPDPEKLKQYYHEQLAQAERLWSTSLSGHGEKKS